MDPKRIKIFDINGMWDPVPEKCSNYDPTSNGCVSCMKHRTYRTKICRSLSKKLRKMEIDEEARNT